MEGYDSDFEAHVVFESEEEDEESADDAGNGQDLTQELADARKERRSRQKLADPVFRRAQVAPPIEPPATPAALNGSTSEHERQVRVHQCIACSTVHVQGSCPLKLAGPEYCGLCSQAHYGSGFRKACTHLRSIEQCQLMLEALKASPDTQEVKDQVKRYLVGIIGNLRHDKKIAEEKKRDALQQQQQQRQPNPPGYGYTAPYHMNGNYASPYQVNGIGKENQPMGHIDGP